MTDNTTYTIERWDLAVGNHFLLLTEGADDRYLKQHWRMLAVRYVYTQTDDAEKNKQIDEQWSSVCRSILHKLIDN